MRVAAALGASHTMVENLSNLTTQGISHSNLLALAISAVPVLVAGLE